MSLAESAVLDRRASLAKARLKFSLSSAKGDAKDAAKPDELVREHPVATLAGAFASALLVGSWLVRPRRPKHDRTLSLNGHAATNGAAKNGAAKSKLSKFAEHPVLASIQAAAMLVVASARSFLVRQVVDAWQGAPRATDGDLDIAEMPTNGRGIPFE